MRPHVDEKLALIDELWESVRRSAEIQIRSDHVRELEQRAAAVSADPSLALPPAPARALLKKRPSR
ncbi:MAG: addiction module protein [Verrucomicrobiota bacterium]